MLWIGNTAVWILPSFWWLLTFANVRVLDIIYTSWLEYAVSNFTPFLYIASLLMFIFADVKLIDVPSTPGIKGVNKKEVNATLIVHAVLSLALWLFVFFFGKDAIMFVDYTLLDQLEWEDPGYLAPSLFTA